MYLIQAVQTSWRPQLPLPKELHISDENCDDGVDDTEPTPTTRANMHSKKDSLNTSQLSNASGSSKKWSFGRLFRKKKDLETGSSSEEDRKAGFVHPLKHQQRTGGNVAGGASAANISSKAKSKISRGSKLIGAGFDHIVVSPPPQPAARIGVPLLPQHVDQEFFLPVEAVPRHEPYYQNEQPHNPSQDPQHYSRSSNSLDRRPGRSVGHKSTSSQRMPHGQGLHTSSEEELISLNSSTFSKYRSDESIHSGGRVLMQTQGQVQAYSPDFVQGANGQSRRSRAARNERYYKRLSRDGEVSHGQLPVMLAPQPTQRWKTQPVPLSVYNEPPARQGVGHVRHHSHNVLSTAAATPTPSAVSSQRLRNTNSLQHVAPYVQWGHMQQQQYAPKNLQNSVNEQKRSISYDSHIHLQNTNGRLQTKVLPPPPPPRDPLRRVNVAGGGKLQNGSSGDLRPLSYAFDANGVPAVPAGKLSARCVSDDKIWAGPLLSGQYPSTMSVPAPLSRRFITRAERDANPAKKSLPNGLDFQYVADATPRSRKPIHMLEQSAGRHDQLDPPPPSGGILRTTKSGLPGPTVKLAASDFWKRLDEGTQRRGRNIERAGHDAASKPRSISSSRATELRTYPIPLYTEVYKPNRKAPAAPQQDSNDGVVCGSLHIKPNQFSANSNYVEIRHKDEKKSHSMPGRYQRRSDEIPSALNKYDEYVAEKLEQHHKPFFNAPPMMPYRKLSVQMPPTAVPAAILQQQPATTPPPIYYPRKKPANLEEAISELEAIYKSLGLSEPPAAAEKETDERRLTPDDFEKFALAHADEYEDEDSPAGEPDPVRDDVAYRHIQLANLQHKTSEKQPLFGIPIGPIVPAPQTDYLHVTPTADQLKQARTKLAHSPDVVKDDLAVRALRKDPPGPKDRFLYPASGSLLQKKNRATRTQSANIYSLIQRDAAKPAGGDILSLMELTRNIDCSGSLSDLRKGGAATTAADDIPATLTLLRSLKEQELQQQHGSPRKLAAPIPFRHPSQGGAISQLPERLTSPTHREESHKGPGPGSAPVPLPRTSLTPEPGINHQMEDALNKIVQDAQESSVKLSRELQELRREALITATRPKLKINADEERLEKDLQEIEAVSEAAKRCGQMLLETLPDTHDAAANDAEAAGASTSYASHNPRKIRTEGKLIIAIDQVSEAANAVCEKILKDIVTTEPPVVLQHTTQITNTKKPESLVMPNLIKKLDPIQSDKIEAIAKRCMRQLSELGEQSDCDESTAEIDQRQPPAPAPSSVVACNDACAARSRTISADHSLICTVAEKRAPPPPSSVERQVEEIDKIMQECEEQVRSQAVGSAAVAAAKMGSCPSADDEKSTSRTRRTVVTTSGTCAPTNSNSSSSNAGALSSTAAAAAAAVTVAKSITSSVSSSSDCLAKSSSPSSASRRQQSSSITSFNPYSSSDYIKSPSSEYHAPSTDPIKTFSTTSYDVQSTSATPNITTTNSTFSYSPSPTHSPSPSPPLNLTPVSSRARSSAAGASSGACARAERSSEERLRQSSSSPSQYNSSEELAMIFGIEEKPKQQQQRRQQRRQQQQQQQESHQQPLISGNTGRHHVLQAQSNHESSAMPADRRCHSFFSSANTAMQRTNIDAAAAAIAIVAPRCPPSPATNHNSPALNVDLDIVVVVVDNEFNATTTISSAYSTTTITTATNASISPTNTTSASPAMSNCGKLATIVEQPAVPKSEGESPSSNLGATPSIESLAADEQTHFDSLSSLEEISSNPDSGNVSLADFPLSSHGSSACLQLQSAYNSRYELKAAYVSEVCIAQERQRPRRSPRCSSSSTEKDAGSALDFPPPPSAEELLLSEVDYADTTINHTETRRDGTADNSSAPSSSSRSSSPLGNSRPAVNGATCEAPASSFVVYETPQLSMSITEVRLNFEQATVAKESLPAAETESNQLVSLIHRCTAEVERLNESLEQLPRQRSIQHPDETVSKSTGGSRISRTNNTQNRPCDDGADETKQPSTNGASQCLAVSLLGETRSANRWTALEQDLTVLVACSLGVISPNDIFTLFLIIIGIITIIAIVLF